MPPDRANWRRVASVLDAALDARPEERDALLDRLCGEDSALRREVESLLAADRVAEDFLESSATTYASAHLLERPEPGELPGSVIGRYRLIEELGRGGMGIVWLAERADGEFEQRVALKLVKRGIDSAELELRFRRERQILARLEHPNIARLLDGGISEDGRPYFVMELVAGVRLTRYCDSAGLSVERRLTLFGAVCRAVQYAHQNLIVHRDIKQSNVLVTAACEVKLLDFGVASLLDEQEPELTRGAKEPMTPEYASPEQVTGGPISTASDVYQLGVLLHELLCGRRPNLKEAHSLRGGLDAIVLRAIQKDPAQRYPSPDALAQDLERHLAHRPLLFGVESWRHRAGKFFRRNQARVIAAVLLVMVGGLLAAGYVRQIRAERDRAQHEVAKSSESAAMLARLFWGWSPDAANRREISAANLLGDAARRAESELKRDPETLASILSVLGDLHSAVGLTTIADSLLKRALAIQERLPAQVSLDLAGTLGRRGKLLWSSGRAREAEPLLRRARTIFLSQLAPERPEVLNVQYDLANVFRVEANLSGAEGLFRDGLARSASAPLNTEFASSLGYILFLEGRYEEAEALLRATLGRQREIFGRLHVSPFHTMRSLASTLRDQGKLAESVALNREALEISRTLFGPDHPETSITMLTLALVLERQGALEEAERYARGSLARIRRDRRAGGSLEIGVMGSLASILVARGKLEEAEPMLRRALAGQLQEGRQGDEGVGDQLNRLAYCLALRGAPDAEEIYWQAVAFDAARSPSGPFFVSDGYQYLAELARRHGNRALAEKLFRRALGLYERQLPVGHPYRVMVEAGLRLLLNSRP